MYVTPRTLLAIIRLSQAMAKLNFRNEVKQTDVDEALKLMNYSIQSLAKVSKNPSDYKNAKRAENKNSRMTEIMTTVR